MAMKVTVLALLAVWAAVASAAAGLDAVERGADPTGQRDSAAVMQKALDELNRAGGGTLYLPPGKYRLEKPLYVEGGNSIRGAGSSAANWPANRPTILCVAFGRGDTNLVKNAAVKLRGGASLRDVAIWHPDQSFEEPVPYPASIWGDGHTSVVDVTLVNSWCGFYNNHCSSMLVRGLRGTALNMGIRAAYAFDVPRIEHVAFDPAYWAASGLPGSPKTPAAVRKLEAWAENNLIAIVAGEQDWGYWWDVFVDHAKGGIFLTVVPDDKGERMNPGNIAAGKVVMRNVQVGIEMKNVGYPGFLLTYGDIQARLCCMHYSKVPDYSKFHAVGIKPYYSWNAAVQVTGVKFSGAKTLFRSDKDKDGLIYCINFNDCTFSDWKDCAISQLRGSLVASNCRFSGKGAIRPGENLSQIVLSGNTFSGEAFAVKPSASTVVARDDREKGVVSLPYDIPEPKEREFKGKVFDVLDYGATPGKVDDIPVKDSSPAFAAALAAAGKAGGGTVFAPAGVYRIARGLKVPSGVELRGSFEAQHYGNSTHRGTQLYAYAGKGEPASAPLVTLEPDSGVGGFTVYYPEQGVTDDSSADEALRVKRYPPTMRTAPRCQVRNMAIVNAWTAIDAITVRSDGLFVTDVTGGALDAGVIVGHGTTGGLFRDVHFNYTGWVGQGKYENHPRGDDWDKTTTCGMFADFTTRVTRGFVLCDAKDVKLHSCFCIMVAEGVSLEKDPYTGGSFKGSTWGLAFDANTNGIVGHRGAASKFVANCAMGVFSRQQGGYFVKTEPGFAGAIASVNSEIWSGRSRIVNLEGGRTILSQFLSWCCYEGVVKKGASLTVCGASFASNNGNDKGEKTTITYERGSSGAVCGSVDGRRFLKVVDETGGRLAWRNNGVRID